MHLDMQFNKNLTDACVSSLPPNLRHLVINGAQLTDACFQLMPPQLEELVVSGNSSRCTNRCAGRLPRGLRMLSGLERLTDACLGSMPAALKTWFVTTDSKITVKGVTLAQARGLAILHG